jgi:YHS domain-containing protein
LEVREVNISSGNIRGALIGVLLLTGMVFSVVIMLNREAHSGQKLLSERVEAIEVCMVNDRVMGKPQIPVEYEDKTYYGCCQGCVNRIKNDRAIRYSSDPVTGGEVDKATAYIVEGHGGEALYFESVQTAKQYSLKNAEYDGPAKKGE